MIWCLSIFYLFILFEKFGGHPDISRDYHPFCLADQNDLSCYHSLLIFVLSSTNSSGVLNNINIVWSFRMEIFVTVHLNEIEFHRYFSYLVSLEGSHLESWHRFFCILAGFLRLLFPSSLRLEKGLTYMFFKKKSNKKLATFEMIFEMPFLGGKSKNVKNGRNRKIRHSTYVHVHFI